VAAAGWDGALTRFEGALLLAAFVGVLPACIARTRREQPELQDAIAAFVQARGGLGLNLSRFAVAVVLLYFGARWVVQSAPVIGLALGMAPLLSGLLVVAIGTALPEVAAAVAAARRGHGDMVAGHVIGSSLFNLLVVLGGMAVVRDVPVPASFVRFELPAALVFAVMLYPILRGDHRVSRAEGGVLLAAFVAWVAFELFMANAA
jgi:cation:H+ antiporter